MTDRGNAVRAPDTRYVLLTGGNGQLGTELRRRAWPPGWRPVAPDRGALDLSDAASIDRALQAGCAGRPYAAVINCGAYTAVDAAETHAGLAWAINAEAPARLAQLCAAQRIPIIHVSTDYVFDGSGQTPWEVHDPIAPINLYGRSKAAGEAAIRASGARHAIVRTSWLFSARRSNFVTTMLSLAERRDHVAVVADQWGCPTSAADLAAGLTQILMAGVADDEAGGLFHFSNTGPTTWAEFAAEILRQSQCRGGPHAQVTPIPTRAYPTAARRPANAILGLSAIRDVHGIEPRDWRAALADVMDEIAAARGWRFDQH